MNDTDWTPACAQGDCDSCLGCGHECHWCACLAYKQCPDDPDRCAADLDGLADEVADPLPHEGQ